MSSNSTTDAQSQGLALLEEWPQRESLTDFKKLKLPANKKQVTFATYSTKHLYKCSSAYRSTMSYRSADQRLFKAGVAQEGLRIQRLVSSCPGNINTGNAIHLLMERGLLSREEIIGIEHYVTKDAPARLLYERRAHAAVVLKAQKELLAKSQYIVDKLSHVSAASSAKSMQKARLRAVLALTKSR